MKFGAKFCLGSSSRMFRFIIIFVLFNLDIIIVRCSIPSSSHLTVRNVDNKLIERKRLDTLEMCRIFENERSKTGSKVHHKRSKREIGAPRFDGVPTLRQEDIKRVENIVDRLYDDLDDGERVTYRQRNIKPETTTAGKLKKNLSKKNKSRRFDFAPAFLEGPGSKESHPNMDHATVPVPWIKKWKHGIIPYFIDPNTYDSGLQEVIMTAFDYFERATCIRLQRLREKPQDKMSMQFVEWAYITNPMGIRQCVHSNERIPNKGVQMVVLGYDCMSTGEIVHEVMHILGYSHEHTRPDRDSHVTIMWDNIKPGYKKYFEMRSEDPLLRLPYDYASVLHYPPRAFSKNGQITVAAKSGVKLGQRDGLSETDVEKVAMIFGQECVDRNKEYLLTTCPSVVKSKNKTQVASPQEIVHYFKDRLWKYGVVVYKLYDKMEFSIEERENIQQVIKHIQKETCIDFRDADAAKEEEEYTAQKKSKKQELSQNVTTPEEDDGVTRNDTESAQEADATSVTAGDGSTVAAESKEDIANESNVLETTVSDLVDEESTYAPDEESENTNRVKRSLPGAKRRGRGAHRRHADSVLVFKRSVEPGCKCPSPGKPVGEVKIELSADCFNSANDLLHVFVHILGLDHQHNMHDRDEFLHIVWDKLTPEVKEDMEKKLPPAAAVGFAYDYQSVMHFPWLQIKDGVTSIMYPIWNDGWAMGHWQGLSYTDVLKLNAIYLNQCRERETLQDQEDD